jgi:hypothetical protein
MIDASRMLGSMKFQSWSLAENMRKSQPTYMFEGLPFTSLQLHLSLHAKLQNEAQSKASKTAFGWHMHV